MFDLHEAAERLVAAQDNCSPSMERVRASARTRRRRRRGGLASIVALALILIGVFVARDSTDDDTVIATQAGPTQAGPWSAEYIARTPGTPRNLSCLRLTVGDVTRETCAESRAAEYPSYWRVAGEDFALFTDWDALPEPTESDTGAPPLTVLPIDDYFARSTPRGLTCGTVSGAPDIDLTARIVVGQINDALEARFGSSQPPIEVFGCSGGHPISPTLIIRGQLGTTLNDAAGARSITLARNGDHFEVLDSSP